MAGWYLRVGESLFDWMKSPDLRSEEKKEDLLILNFRLFKITFPLIIGMLEVFSKLDCPNHKKIVELAYADSIELLTLLAAGYNSYHSKDKAELYFQARKKLSGLQVLTMAMCSLGLLSETQAAEYCSGLEESILASGGLIRKMEQTK